MFKGLAGDHAQGAGSRRRVRRQLFSLAAIPVVGGGLFGLRHPRSAAVRTDRLSDRGEQSGTHLAMVRAERLLAPAVGILFTLDPI
jgi:hypothetical protein